MANKVKNHPQEILDQIKNISTALHAAFIAKRLTISQLSEATDLSTNSIKSIFKGGTANIASYLTLANALGLSIISTSAATQTTPVQASTEDSSGPEEVVEVETPFPG